MAAIPGETISALQVVLLRSAGENDEHASAMAQSLLGGGRIAGSAVKDGSARLIWRPGRSAAGPGGGLRSSVP